MFLASHVVSGGLIYDSLREEPFWIKWPLFFGGIFVFHALLDSVPAWHNMDFPWNAWQWFVAAFNLSFVVLWLWQFEKLSKKWLQKIFLKRIFIGLTAWMIFDWEWVFRYFYPSYPAYLHSLFPNMGRWGSHYGFILEALFIALVALLGFRSLIRRRAAIGKKIKS